MRREDPRTELAQAWLTRAAHDLAAAKRLMDPPTLPAEAGFHAQQSAEKALKCILVLHDRPFPKTHDLAHLLDQCEGIADVLLPSRPDLIRLTRFALAGRYPDSGREPTTAVTTEAVALAEHVYEVILAMVAPEVQP